MRAISHALTGATIGILVNEPAIALPASYLSHHVCDMIPHYGANLKGNEEVKSLLFNNLIYLDAFACFVLVLLFALYRPHNWLIAIICAFLATSPDFISIPKFLYYRKHPKSDTGYKPSKYEYYATKIQWFEKPIGAFVDLAWSTACIFIIVPFFVYR